MFKKNNKISFFVLIFTIFIFMPIFGYLHKLFLGPSCTSFVCPSHAEYVDGFFISYMFFVPIFLIILGNEKKYKNLLILLGLVAFFDIFMGSFEILIIDLCFALIGWLLAEIALRVKEKTKSKQ